MYSLIEGGPISNNGICVFMISSAADLAGLPDYARPGSKAYTADMSAVYVLDFDGTWKQTVGKESRVASALEEIAHKMDATRNRIVPLNDSSFITGSVIEIVGIPEYVDDVSDYSDYGITDTGWYVFGRIYAADDTRVTAGTTIEGADGYVATVDADHVDVAVRFEVAAMTKTVIVDWGSYIDTFSFKATDLAIRNLDYRTTFYVYDIAPFATWSFKFTPDTAFVDGTRYFVKQDGEFVPAEVITGDPVPAYFVKSYSYALTADTVFQANKEYYIYGENEGGEYEYLPAIVEALIGEAIPADTYYEETVTYVQTTHETFRSGFTYYTFAAELYTAAEVTTGESVPASTYYELDSETGTYALTSDATFQDGKTYYTKSVNVYIPATVTVGAPVPAYYVHEKVRFEGMTRNITYKLDEIIDCPSEFVLPAIEDDGHGAWFEIRLRHSGSFSSTLVPLDEEVKIATEHTQAETAGINMIDLHYNNVGGVKIWRFMNTHSSIPA